MYIKFSTYGCTCVGEKIKRGLRGFAKHEKQLGSLSDSLTARQLRCASSDGQETPSRADASAAGEVAAGQSAHPANHADQSADGVQYFGFLDKQ